MCDIFLAVLARHVWTVRGLLVAVGRCNARVRLSLIYAPVSLLDLRYLGSSEEGLTFGHT